MQFREFGRTGWKISSVSFGAWAIGGTWGEVSDSESMRALHQALDCGINFFDTADVYGDGRSERLLAQLRTERSEPFYIATKAGRRLSPHVAQGYNRANLTAFIDRSLQNLQTDALDLLQLHCPPTEVYYMPELFNTLDAFVSQGKLRYYGVSVERVEEALKAIEYPNVQSVQIVYNIFRQRPQELFFSEAMRRQVGILARLPLSSGMLSGKFSFSSTFAADDHRQFNREGAAFDRGETFSGLDYQAGLLAVESLRGVIPEGMTMAQMALRWILMSPGVSSLLAGAKQAAQVTENALAADLPALSDDTMKKIAAIYTDQVRPHVHHNW